MVATGLMNDIAYEHLSLKTKKAILGQCLFLTFALVIPTITHRLGLNYLIAQPMHWMILFAGLTYGPISGMILGASIPIASFILTGMPIAIFGRLDVSVLEYVQRTWAPGIVAIILQIALLPVLSGLYIKGTRHD